MRDLLIGLAMTAIFTVIVLGIVALDATFCTHFGNTPSLLCSIADGFVRVVAPVSR